MKRNLIVSVVIAGALFLSVSSAYAQAPPPVHSWSWDPSHAQVRAEAQVFVDEPDCTFACFTNDLGMVLWHDPNCAPPNPPPLFWNWGILPPPMVPAPPLPPIMPPVDWDKYPPSATGPDPRVGPIFVGFYCPSPTSDSLGNPPPPTPPECDLDWSQRVQFLAPIGLNFHNMLGHPSLTPEKQVVNWAFASDGDVPYATIPCINFPFVRPGVEVTGEVEQVITVRGKSGMTGITPVQTTRTWELRLSQFADSFSNQPPPWDVYVCESAGTMVMQIPLEITGLTPGKLTKFTFDFQTLGETYSETEDQFYLIPPDGHAAVGSDSDNAYAVAMVNIFEGTGGWLTQFIEYAGDPPGFPDGTFQQNSAKQGGAAHFFTPTETTHPVGVRVTSRVRTNIEDEPDPADDTDYAFASMKANIWLTVFGPSVMGDLVKIAEDGPGPSYCFWMGKHEVSNVEFVDFLNDAEEDANDPDGPTEKSAYMVFDQNTGAVSTPGGEPMFVPIDSPTPGGGVIQKIRYRPHLPPGTRYVADPGAEPDAVVGVTWIGALKYSNWLTLHVGYPPSERCYTEGDELSDWHPVTISTADWAVRDLNDAEREDLVENYRGLRLPMDNLGLSLGFIDNQVNEYNEWYKASAYDPAAPDTTRTGPGGEDVPPLHWIYGFGRDTIEDVDANYFDSGDPFDNGVAHVGFFNGTNILINGDTTNDTDNPYGLYDLAGNVAEWGQDKGPGFVDVDGVFIPSHITRTGSWDDTDANVAASWRDQDGTLATSTTVGFRVLTTHEPPDPGACPADLTGPNGFPDGVIDVFDLLQIIGEWGPCSDPANCPADISGPAATPDGIVDVFDLLEVVGNWGPCP